MEMVSSAAAGTMLTELSESGLLLSPCLGRPEALQLLPPAVVSRPQLDRALRILRETLLASRHVLSREEM